MPTRALPGTSTSADTSRRRFEIHMESAHKHLPHLYRCNTKQQHRIAIQFDDLQGFQRLQHPPTKAREGTPGAMRFVPS
eukprot:6464213-Amphidinium_carterae.1